ncbi:SulP family inorganic anion transporter [Haloimpatiens sp. FM7315]|uniref:SulP family inorganic anion transporter n=1 Tax=Haloimpatiens sp. FM7315 TaxID=3298609 RepID=UPI00370C600C
MNNFKPMLFTSMKTYSKEQFIKDVIAGIIVAIIALPLSIALAMASGVSPERGIYTAIVAGFLISAFGGSTVQIAGPTAAFATIVAGIVATSGTSGLVVATIMAGIILVIMGIFKFGNLIKFIPTTIITGFTAGIAVTILIGQFKDFFGITYINGVAPVETMEKLAAFFSNFNTINWMAVLVGVVCLAIQILWPLASKKIPSSLIAVIVGILMVKCLHLHVNTIGDLYTISNKLPSFCMPKISFSLIQHQLPNAFVIAVLAAIESLLSCVVADGMVNSKHRSNTELIAQGIGNLGSALFGGIPATGAIARTAANIKNGGRTPISGIVHAISLTLVLLVLMTYAAWIPMPTIAAILFIVAYNMCQWRSFVNLCKKAPKSDIFVLILTFALTVLFDLVVAIEIGMIVACLMFIKRMSDETNVNGWRYKEEDDVENPDELIDVPKHVRVYEVSGPLFFGASETLTSIEVKDYTKNLIIRMRSVPAMDITSMISLEDIYNRCKKNGIQLVLSHVNEQPYKVMKKAGFIEKLGEENLLPNIDAALEWVVKDR